MIERSNKTAQSDAGWRKDLASSFSRAAARAGNEFIKEWYEQEAARLLAQDES